MAGGDLRLNIDEIHLLNKYGCRPFLDLKHLHLPPLRPQAFLILLLIKTDKVRSILISNSLKTVLRAQQ
jgi:hypothetical protein